MQNDLQQQTNTGIEQIKPVGFDAPDLQKQKTKSGVQKKHLVIGILGFFVSLIVLFLLTTRALLITTNAEQADIQLSEGFAISLGEDRYLIFNGQYRVEINAPGYYTNVSQPIINSESPSTLNIELAPLPGQIKARFVMDPPQGQAIQQANIRLLSPEGIVIENPTVLDGSEGFLFENLPAGSYKLLADAYLYQPSEFDI